MVDKLVSNDDAAEILAKKEELNPDNFKKESKKESKKLPTVEELHDKHVAERTIDGVLQENTNTSAIHGAADNTWKAVPLDVLPSKGLFYADNAQITIRPAYVEEIRHWSTMDEFDPVSINDKMNMIIEKCVRLQDSNRLTFDWREISEIDRLFLIIRIYELTFPNKENVLNLKFGCNLQCKGDGNYKEDVPLSSGLLNMFSIPDEIMQYYDSTKKCFVAHSEKLGKDILMYMPSIGVSQYVKNLINEARVNDQHLDISFAKIAPYLFKDWASVKKSGEYERVRGESFRWETTELLFINGVADKLEAAINLNIKKECPKCGVTLEIPLFFRGGFTIKSFFAVSTGFNDLI